MDEQEFEVFDSLPPALRRKLFSNVERFRLEQMRLAQVSTLDRRGSDPSSRCPNFASTPTKLCRHPRGSSSPKARERQGRPSLPVTPLNGKRRCKSSHRVLQKPSAQLQTAYLTAQADSEWFQSLPPKVQQRHFSAEEQSRLGGWRSSVIFDAADQALYKFGSAAGESSLSLPGTSTLSRSSSVSSMSSAARFDSAVDVDGSLYDSFRWLDEEDNIDLSLDYHAHLAETAPTKTKSRRKRPSSFRRTISISSSHGSISALPSPRLRSQTASQPHPFNFSFHNNGNNNNNSNTLLSRSVSKSVAGPHLPTYLPQSSHSSVDHPAQFYQDPEARLKLRVYLASPQKFDEAIEFGFPSLEHNDNLGTPFCFDRKWKMQESPTANTFVDSETISPYDVSSGPPSPRTAVRPKTSAADLTENTWRKPSVCDSQHSRPSFSDRRRPVQPMVVGSSTHMGTREMTLKMTLTRPDLRSSDLLASPKSSTTEEDPLKLADLPVDEKAPVWDKPDKCSMKSVWRKITGR
ncbi:hypothetical protein MaudCBS49596_006770 [Microsporum audouinii]